MMDSHQQMSSSQQCRITGQEMMMMMSCDDVSDSQQQLSKGQLQQKHSPEFAVSSDELVHSQRPELTLDAVMTPRNYIDDLCPVCNDRVSGYHYGLQTCESCKGDVITYTRISSTVNLTCQIIYVGGADSKDESVGHHNITIIIRVCLC